MKGSTSGVAGMGPGRDRGAGVLTSRPDAWMGVTHVNFTSPTIRSEDLYSPTSSYWSTVATVYMNGSGNRKSANTVPAVSTDALRPRNPRLGGEGVSDRWRSSSLRSGDVEVTRRPPKFPRVGSHTLSSDGTVFRVFQCSHRTLTLRTSRPFYGLTSSNDRDLP